MADHRFGCRTSQRIAEHFAKQCLSRPKFRAEQHELQTGFAIGLFAEQEQLSDLIGNLIAGDIFSAVERRAIQQRERRPGGRFVLLGPGTGIERQTFEPAIGGEFFLDSICIGDVVGERDLIDLRVGFLFGKQLGNRFGFDRIVGGNFQGGELSQRVDGAVVVAEKTVQCGEISPHCRRFGSLIRECRPGGGCTFPVATMSFVQSGLKGGSPASAIGRLLKRSGAF